MKADNITLQGILNSPNRYIIPVFQRYYSWRRPEWAQLWENLMELREYEGEEKETHFMGALVFVPEADEMSMPTFLVIDGQQRLLTLSLLLCALRNVARSHEFVELAAEITDTYLVHPYRKMPAHFRLYPRQRDREEYLAIVKHVAYKGDRGSITQALIYFLRRVQSLEPADGFTEQMLRDLFHLVATNLEFVYITLDEENPYRIFKSLNSTGVNLSEADLIRNFMLMEVGSNTAEQDAFDDEYWRPLEKLFVDDKGQLNSRDFSYFFRDFLMKDGQYIPTAATFYNFENRYQTEKFDVQALTLELHQFAQLYNIVRGLQPHPHKQVNRALHRLRLLNTRTTYPLLLNLLGRMAAETLSVREFSQCTELIAAFIRQRHELDEASRPYSRWFAAANRHLGDRPYDNLCVFLQEKGFEPEANSR